MKEKTEENRKLPLVLKFMKQIKQDETTVFNSQTILKLQCESYQTDFLTRKKPYKSITRLL